MFVGRFRHQVERVVKPVGEQLRRTKLSPDHLTLIGLIVACGAAVAIGLGQTATGNGEDQVIGLATLYFRNRLEYFCKTIVLNVLRTLVIGWRVAITVVDKIKRIGNAIDVIDGIQQRAEQPDVFLSVPDFL